MPYAKKGGTMPGALDGIKILELTRVGPGAFCTMMLADMGAEVLKIEPPPSGQLAGSGASPGPEEAGKLATSFTNRNKKSLTLNLKDPAGQAVLQDLAKGFDILVEGFRPGVMKRLGGDYETLSQVNPRLVYCSLSGFGQDGPYRDRPAHDMNYLSLAGVLNLIGEADRKPAIPLNLVADYAGASLHGALVIVLAPYARERTGRGQRRGGSRAPGGRGAHPDPRPRRLVRGAREGRRVRREGLRRGRDGRGPAEQSPPDGRGRRAPHPRSRPTDRDRDQALRHARDDPERGATAVGAHRGRAEGPGHGGRRDRRAQAKG